MMFLRFFGLAAGLLAGGIVAQTPPCWENDYGTAVSPVGGPDTGLALVTLPFNFPVPGGGTTNVIQASTNGFLWLDGTSTGNPGAPNVIGSDGLLTLAPRICVGWADLDLDPGDRPEHGLYVNTGFPGRAVITFVGNDYGSTPLNRIVMQAQLLANGAFILGYRRLDQYVGTSTSGSHTMLVGVSQGSGATSAGEADFSAGPVSGGTNPTIWELFLNPNQVAGDPRDLGAIPTLLFFPNGTGSYDVTPMPCDFAIGNPRGAGCPSGGGGEGYVFEYFAGGTFDLVQQTILYRRQPSGSYDAQLSPAFVWESGYSNRIDTVPGVWQSGTGDDSLSVGQPLGFTASFWDGVPTTEAWIASNGRVYLASGGISTTAPSATSMNNGPCCIALWSDDLDCRTMNLPAGSGLYVDRLGSPTRLVITFDGIPVYSSSPPSGETVTGQVQLYQTGDVLVSIAAHSITGAGYCGFFRGRQSGTLSTTTDETDLSTALVPPGLTIGIPLEPMAHDADLGILGATPNAYAHKLPPGALAAVLHVGADQATLSLDVIGMTGCTGYTTVIVGAFPMAQLGNTASMSLGLLPNVPALVGGTMTTQALAVVPGINPLQIVASNGWDWVFGVN